MKTGATLVPASLPASEQAVLAEAGRSGQVFLVGGLIRDYLSGKPSWDIDLAVAGVDPLVIARAISSRFGLSRPVVYPRFKTVLVAGRLAGDSGSGETIQVEICSLEGNLATDAARRDFTVNCLYLDLASFDRRRRSGVPVLDPTGLGLRDLDLRILRTPQEPASTIWSDPLRMLRAVRFHAIDGFRLDRRLVEMIDRMAYLLTRPAPERIRVELEKILSSPRPEGSLQLMQRLGINAVVLPEVAETYGFAQQTPYHAYDLFTHLVKTMAAAPPVVELRLAALLHDVGKLKTQLPKQDRMVYYGHEDVSRDVAASVTRRLRFSRRTAELVTFLVASHMIHYSSAWSDRAVRRFAQRMGSRLEDVLVLAEADRRAQGPGRGGGSLVRELRRRLRDLERQRGPGPELPLDGRDIMRLLEVGPGPLVGRAKAFLLEESLKRPRRISRAEAARILRAWKLRIDVDNPAGS